MSAKGRRGRGRRRPDAVGRWAAAGRPITPSAVRRSSVAVVVRPSSRATGTPRSVITTSSPLRARSSHSLRCALSSVTATSMLESYTLTSINLYMKSRRAVCGYRVRSGCTPSGLFRGPPHGQLRAPVPHWSGGGTVPSLGTRQAARGCVRRGSSGSGRLAGDVRRMAAAARGYPASSGRVWFAGGAWNGQRWQCVQSELSGHSVVASVQSGASGRCAVFMVRRRSTVRFRKEAPGHRAFSIVLSMRTPSKNATRMALAVSC